MTNSALEARTVADFWLGDLISSILDLCPERETRNHKARSNFFFPVVLFKSTPLVTVRRTFWQKALAEMEWFLMGTAPCPDTLANWWEGQLDENDRYINGYGTQFRSFATQSGIPFDQIKFLLQELKAHPNSRRLLLTAWNPGDMARITVDNNNPKTPTTCHSTLVHFFVEEGPLRGILHMKSYQRSADSLLGVQHNWIQSWALLQFLAYHCGYDTGTLQWRFGDAHVYMHPTHTEVAEKIADWYADSALVSETEECQLSYDYSGVVDVEGYPMFLARDFTLTGNIPAPITKLRPALL